MINNEPVAVYDYIDAAIYAIRRHPFFADVPIVFIPENNPGQGSSDAHLHFTNRRSVHSNVLTMQESGRGTKFGVPKTASSTMAMRFDFEKLMRTNSISILKDLRTIEVGTGEKLVEKLFRQIYTYSYDIHVSPTGVPYVKLTGKTNGGNDDVLIATMMIPYWRQVFLERPFAPYRDVLEM